MYSASQEDKATVGCLRVFQLTGALPAVNMNPVVERLSMGSFAQSASTCQTKIPSFFLNTS